MTAARRRKERGAAAAPPSPGTARPFRWVALGLLALLCLAGALWWLRSRPSRRVNLLLVTIDTLRADHVGAYGDARAATPVLDALAHAGVRFENALSAVPLTGPSHATILTGRFPPQHGVRDNVAFRLDARQATLATLLERAGYRTGAFIGAYPVASGFGFGQGFDHFSEELDVPAEGGQGAERPANKVADAALGWLSEPRREPFFAWIHFYDPHAPYTPPPPYAATFRDRPYDGEVAFADAQLGRILDALRASGRDRTTLVVVLSDHGEGLGDHDEATHGVLIYQSTLRVPWIIAGPGVAAGSVVASPVGTVDVVPTVLGLLGAAAPEGLPGRDLRSALAGGHPPRGPLYAESLFARLNCRWSSLRGWIEGDWKLVEGREPELFDLATDPAERSNRAAGEPDRVRRMREALHAALEKMAPSGDAVHAATLSPEQEERLRSLGYVGGAASVASIDEPGLPDPKTHIRLYDRLQAFSVAEGPLVAPALEEAVTIAREDPGNPFGHSVVASLAFRAGVLGIAEEALARAAALQPDRPSHRELHGRVLREMGRLAESERELRVALGLTTPDDVRTRVSLAETLIELGRGDEAGTLIDAVLSKDPRNAMAALAKGRLLIARGQPADAVPFLERAAEHRDLESRLVLAEAQVAAGKPQEARRLAAEVLDRQPRHPWALAVLGQALLREGRRAEGLAALESALAARPRRASVWQSLARGFEAAGAKGKAALCRREASASSAAPR